MLLHKQKPLWAAVIIAVLILLLTAIKARQSGENGQPGGQADAGDPTGVAMESRTAAGNEAATVGGRQRSSPILASAEELSPDEQKRMTAAQIAELDQRLRSERIDAQWAMEQEAVIRAAAVGTPTDNFKVEMPEVFEQQCRSSLCRVRMVYQDEEDAMQMQMKLTLGLGGPIAKARTFYLPTADGGMEVVIYAGAL